MKPDGPGALRVAVCADELAYAGDGAVPQRTKVWVTSVTFESVHARGRAAPAKPLVLDFDGSILGPKPEAPVVTTSDSDEGPSTVRSDRPPPKR